jgi:hypothetical protein
VEIIFDFLFFLHWICYCKHIIYILMDVSIVNEEELTSIPPGELEEMEKAYLSAVEKVAMTKQDLLLEGLQREQDHMREKAEEKYQAYVQTMREREQNARKTWRERKGDKEKLRLEVSDLQERVELSAGVLHQAEEMERTIRELKSTIHEKEKQIHEFRKRVEEQRVLTTGEVTNCDGIRAKLRVLQENYFIAQQKLAGSQDEESREAQSMETALQYEEIIRNLRKERKRRMS